MPEEDELESYLAASKLDPRTVSEISSIYRQAPSEADFIRRLDILKIPDSEKSKIWGFKYGQKALEKRFNLFQEPPGSLDVKPPPHFPIEAATGLLPYIGAAAGSLLVPELGIGIGAARTAPFLARLLHAGVSSLGPAIGAGLGMAGGEAARETTSGQELSPEEILRAGEIGAIAEPVAGMLGETITSLPGLRPLRWMRRAVRGRVEPEYMEPQVAERMLEPDISVSEKGAERFRGRVIDPRQAEIEREVAHATAEGKIVDWESAQNVLNRIREKKGEIPNFPEWDRAIRRVENFQREKWSQVTGGEQLRETPRRQEPRPLTPREAQDFKQEQYREFKPYYRAEKFGKVVPRNVVVQMKHVKAVKSALEDVVPELKRLNPQQQLDLAVEETIKDILFESGATAAPEVAGELASMAVIGHKYPYGVARAARTVARHPLFHTKVAKALEMLRGPYGRAGLATGLRVLAPRAAGTIGDIGSLIEERLAPEENR